MNVGDGNFHYVEAAEKQQGYVLPPLIFFEML
jgi:hypothetical protein